MTPINNGPTSLPAAPPALPSLPADLTPLICTHIGLRERQAFQSLLLVNNGFAGYMGQYCEAAALMQDVDGLDDPTLSESQFLHKFDGILQKLENRPAALQAQLIREIGMKLGERNRAGRLSLDALRTCLTRLLAVTRTLPVLEQARPMAQLIRLRYPVELYADGSCHASLFTTEELCNCLPLHNSDRQKFLIRYIASERLLVAGELPFSACLQTLMAAVHALPEEDRVAALEGLYEGIAGTSSHQLAEDYFQHMSVNAGNEKETCSRYALLTREICACLENFPQAFDIDSINRWTGLLLSCSAPGRNDETAIALLRALTRYDSTHISARNSRWHLELSMERIMARLAPGDDESSCRRIVEAIAVADTKVHARLLRMLLVQVAQHSGVSTVLLQACVLPISTLPAEVRERQVIPTLITLLNQGKFENEIERLLRKSQDATSVETKNPEHSLQSFALRSAAVIEAINTLPDAQASEMLLQMNRARSALGFRSQELICPDEAPSLEAQKNECFFMLALPRIRKLPPLMRAELIAQWEIPARWTADQRRADDMPRALIASLADSADQVPAKLLVKAICMQLQRTVIGTICSPERARLALSQLECFSAPVQAGVLIAALDSVVWEDKHYDVRFQCVLEAAEKLPDEERAQVLQQAALQLSDLPYGRDESGGSAACREQILQQREKEVFSRFELHASASDAALRAYVQPAFVPRQEIYPLLLSAASRLPVAHRAQVLGALCDRVRFSRFCNGSTLSDAEQMALKSQLLSAVLTLEQPQRLMLLPGCMEVFVHDEYSYNPHLQRGLKQILDLPEADARPLFQIWLGKIHLNSLREEMREQANRHWAMANRQ